LEQRYDAEFYRHVGDNYEGILRREKDLRDRFELVYTRFLFDDYLRYLQCLLDGERASGFRTDVWDVYVSSRGGIFSDLVNQDDDCRRRLDHIMCRRIEMVACEVVEDEGLETKRGCDGLLEVCGKRVSGMID
jgi:hypothetical protein